MAPVLKRALPAALAGLLAIGVVFARGQVFGHARTPVVTVADAPAKAPSLPAAPVAARASQ